jgi:methyl coenzyme M reductase subunit C-like uncharacterized protein (methanogenesis marker protein 7)
LGGVDQRIDRFAQGDEIVVVSGDLNRREARRRRGEGFVALQSAHAHMVLLEARLAELATAPPAVPLREI